MRPPTPPPPRVVPSASSAGFTLVEMLMSFTILSVGVLGFIGAFMAVSKSVHYSKTRAVANSLLQEKIEAMKNISYYRLIPTTAAISSTEPGITPFDYDPATGFYPPETLRVGDVTYTRRVYVDKVSSGGGGAPTHLPYQDPDSGLKRIKAYVIWSDSSGWMMQELQNLVNNPNRQSLDGQVTGQVTLSGGGSPTGATVMALQNSSWFDAADSAGNYSFFVAPGTYTFEASMQGYFPGTLQNASVVEGTPLTWNMTLVKMSSGTVRGTAYLRDHLVISRVVGDNPVGGFDEEYVEVFNPTTYTWTMSGGSGVGLKYQRRSPYLQHPIDIVYNTASLDSGKFYLFANTTTVHVNGTPRTADAVWNTASGVNATYFGPSNGYFSSADPNIINVRGDGSGVSAGVGALELYRVSGGATIDKVAWKGNGGVTPDPGTYEGTFFDDGDSNGLEQNEQYYRRSSTAAAVNTASGPAYDSANNDSDWGVEDPAVSPPRSTIGASPAQTMISGTPAVGGFVSADDGLSEPATIAADGTFQLVSVATGSWSVSFSSSNYYYQQTGVALASNGQIVDVGAVAITSTTDNGFITGVVRAAQSNTPLSGITVRATSGAPSPPTGATGRYSLTVTPGLNSVTANPGNTSTNYVSQTLDDVDVATGVYAADVDFTLGTGGQVRGRVMIGANPLPGIPATAYDGTTVESEAVSGTDGYFTLMNVATGTYTVALQLEAGEAYNLSTGLPGTASVTLTNPGQVVFSDTFTVTNAFGWATGSLTVSSSPIRTGVMVFATTSTLSSGAYPPDITNAVRTGVQKFYAASSLTDGTYEIALPGGSSPITYNIYAWYTTWTGSTPNIQRRNTTAAITGGATTPNRNMSW